MVRETETSGESGSRTRQTVALQVVCAWCWIALTIAACALFPQRARSRETNLADIASLIEKAATHRSDIFLGKEMTARRIRDCGPEAIPHLLALLKDDKDAEVCELTAYILRDMEGLTEEHLDALIESRRRGNMSIRPAIARVGTSRAIAFLIEDLKTAKRCDPEFVAAFQILGEQGGACLLDLVKSGPKDSGLQMALGDIFYWLGYRAKSAVTPLTDVVSSRQGDETAVRCAVLALGGLGPRAREAGPALKQLANDAPESLGQTVNQALVGIEVSEVVEAFWTRLEGQPDRTVFLDIMSLRGNGRGVGPALVRYLRHGDIFEQAYAATALGYIGFVEAIPDLIQALQADNRWLVYASVKSLGRLHAMEALDPLNKIAQGYWHPAVHEAAIIAVRVIRGEASYESTTHPMEEFRDYMLADVPGHHESPDIPPPGSNRFYAEQKGQLDPDQLKRFAYQWEVNPSRGGETHEIVPNVGIVVDGGYLIGSDQGEFGGDLLFVDLQGKRTRVLRANVHGIHRMTCGIIVVTGVNHLSTNVGTLFKVSKGTDGVWQANRWKELPSAPIASGVRPSGNLFVACTEEKIEISPAGDVQTVGK
ncbi:MAG: HEAT repeat domain-containing protein [Phycisphaerales bacterium]